MGIWGASGPQIAQYPEESIYTKPVKRRVLQRPFNRMLAEITAGLPSRSRQVGRQGGVNYGFSLGFPNFNKFCLSIAGRECRGDGDLGAGRPQMA